MFLKIEKLHIHFEYDKYGFNDLTINNHTIITIYGQ